MKLLVGFGRLDRTDQALMPQPSHLLQEISLLNSDFGFGQYSLSQYDRFFFTNTINVFLINISSNNLLKAVFFRTLTGCIELFFEKEQLQEQYFFVNIISTYLTYLNRH